MLRGFREYAETAPDEVNCMAVAISFPEDEHLPPPVHNQKCIVVGSVYVGDPEKGMEVIQPLRELATPLADISQPMPFRMVQAAFDAFFQRQEVRTYWKSTSATELSDELIDVIATRAQDRPAPLATIVVWLTGGQVNRVGADDAAFSERSAKYLFSVEGTWHDPADDDKVIPWVRETWSAISEFGTGTTYINFAEEGESVVDEAFGAKLEKLAQIKAKYDPENFFHRNNNIAPAAVDDLRRPARAWAGLGLGQGHARAGRLGRARGVHGGPCRGGIHPPRRGAGGRARDACRRGRVGGGGAGAFRGRSLARGDAERG